MKTYEDFYSKNINHYHTIHHVNTLLKLWNEYHDEFLTEYPNLNEDALIEAIKWHDSYYIPGDRLNELKSIINYKKSTSNFNKDVCYIIGSTVIGYDFKTRRKPWIKNEIFIMHDLDWSGFNDYQTFKINCEKICKEAIELGKFDEFNVRKNQINFYRKFSEKPLYLTKTFSKFNEIAKENMLKLADELENTYFVKNL